MAIVVIPFHDWRKIIKEGSRTRDAHFIEVFNKNKALKKVIINRPITLLEILLKKKRRKIEGKVVLKKHGFTLYEVDENSFLIDFISKNFLQQIIQKYKWYINEYSNRHYVSFIKECLAHLNVEDYYILSQNVFAYKLVDELKNENVVFDAWDNFTKFKVYQSLIHEVNAGYSWYAKFAKFWITNAKENISFFEKEFHVKNIHLISNGVDLDRFVHKQDNLVPQDMISIKRPIVGFGGKITQLLDTDLINDVVKANPEISFVFVGQLLDKEVFSRIEKLSNFHYLGDKHYDEYPSYVKNFDLCIVPYVTKEEEKSGANSIKVYEYLATGKKVVGTSGNGLEDLSEYLYLVKDANEFSKELSDLSNYKQRLDLDFHSWNYKAECLVKLLKNEINNK